LQYVQDLAVRSVGTNTVDDRKGEFTLSKILCKAFVRCILRTLKVHIIIADLKIYAKYVDERHIIDITVRGRTSHHEFDSYAEKSTGFWKEVNDTETSQGARPELGGPYGCEETDCA